MFDAFVYRRAEGATWSCLTAGSLGSQLSPLPALSLDMRPRLTRGEVRTILSLPRPATVEVSLYDLTGRRLALLEQGVLKAGRHDLDLDLRRVVGVRAPTGLYFIRLETPRGRTNQRLAFVR